MKTETEWKVEMGTKPYYPSMSDSLICPFLSRQEGFRNDCLRQYCVMWDNECLIVSTYRVVQAILESIKKAHRA